MCHCLLILWAITCLRYKKILWNLCCSFFGITVNPLKIKDGYSNGDEFYCCRGSAIRNSDLAISLILTTFVGISPGGARGLGTHFEVITEESWICSVELCLWIQLRLWDCKRLRAPCRLVGSKGLVTGTIPGTVPGLVPRVGGWHKYHIAYGCCC